MPEQPEHKQLTFDVGGEEPNVSSVRVGGAMLVNREMKKGEFIGIRVIGADGDVIAEGEGYVTAVNFKDKRNQYGEVESTERAHRVTVS